MARLRLTVTFTTRQRHLAAWIALVAALALALMPTLSRALAHGTGNPALAEVCSAQGMLMPAAGDEGAPAQAGHLLDHCAYCGFASHGAAPLPANPLGPVAAAAGVSMPAAFWQAPRPLHPWRAAQPRAPPALS